MLEPGEVQRRLGYHPATEHTAPAYETNRALAILVATTWNGTLPAGREAALALTALQEALMWANAAVACNAGPDWRQPDVDVHALLDDVTELLEGPLHIRSQTVGGGGPVAGDSGAPATPEPARSAPIEPDPGLEGPVVLVEVPVPVEGADRTLHGDCRSRGTLTGRRCELVVGHDGEHRRGVEVWR